ncbi:MAG: flagellar filament capping protein FliD [Candidatus Lambdaproteobacteria bacterium]|nr:flagellar filament capping protein FliD [Candidatus Lambdaproteobacteria bacterium]
MTEINNTTNTQTPKQESAQPSRRVTNADANRISGLGSGLDTQRTIDQLVAVERQRLKPVQMRKLASRAELESYNLLRKGLDALKVTVDTLSGNAIWEGKIVESSDQTVVTATATSGARPGKHTLVVDQLALNHQIASQGFESADDAIGTGRFTVGVGDGAPVSAVIDDTNNTLNGLKDAINNVSQDVKATIIKTGAKVRPYQLVLTSQKTGSVGRINLDIKLQGGTAPSFQNAFEDPSDWTGVGAPVPEGATPLTGTGASTAITRVIGEYTGDEDTAFTFTAVQTGVVGGENALQLRWTDTRGNSGLVELDKFNYSPGEPIPLIDNLSLLISKGEVVVGDEFSVRVRAEKSGRFWQFSEEERKAKVFPPSQWGRQGAEAGEPVIAGNYSGADDKDFTLTVQGSGQIGSSRDLRLLWETSEGESGVLPVGRGYQTGSQLALINGLTIALKPGVLVNGATMSFSATAAQRSSKWWKPEQEREIPAEIKGVGPFVPPEGVEEEEVPGAQPEFPEELGPRISSTKVAVHGTFEGDEAKVYTFTALKDGTVGTTGDLRLKWEDEKGNTGELSIGDGYEIDRPLPFDQGLAVSFGQGRVFEGDSFNVRTRTSTIQPPQDAKIRLGATELGGGLEISSNTNELDDVIEGVKLTLASKSPKPVTITVRGDVDQAIETTRKFVDDYNALSSVAAELSKYDKEKNEAGPLLGDRDLTTIRNQLSQLLIDPVPGLPRESNMVITLGLKITDGGLIKADESTLRSKIEDNFGAVADIFRNKGESSNSGVSFVGMGEKTEPNAEGYPVDITQIATQASYTSPPLGSQVTITEENNAFAVTVDGKQSGQLRLNAGVYSIGEYARALQNAITNDAAVGDAGVRVSVEGDRLRVSSGRFGQRSGITFTALDERFEAGVGLLNGDAVPGLDVAGTIDGEQAEGIGRLLRGADDSETLAGLRVMVSLNDKQLLPDGPEATVKITKGVASRMNTYLGELLDPLAGRMKTISENLNRRIKDIDGQLNRMEERIESKRSRLVERFSKLESQMSSLKNQQSYLSGQIANLPQAGGAGLPGLG